MWDHLINALLNGLVVVCILFLQGTPSIDCVILSLLNNLSVLIWIQLPFEILMWEIIVGHISSVNLLQLSQSRETVSNLIDIHIIVGLIHLEHLFILKLLPNELGFNMINSILDVKMLT